MSLFPAYGEQNVKGLFENTRENSTKTNWLNQSSFTPTIDELSIIKVKDTCAKANGISSEEKETSIENKCKKSSLKLRETKRSIRRLNVNAKRHPEKRKKGRQLKKHMILSKYAEDGKRNCFFVDKTCNKEFLSVVTISRPSVAKYYVKYFMTSCICLNQDRKRGLLKKRLKRYFTREKSATQVERLVGKEVTTESTIPSISVINEDIFTGFEQEEGLTKAVAHFNKSLAKNPNDIPLWFEYVHFQDTIYLFEKSYRKGSTLKGLRVTAERKLAILDKALTYNPTCEDLLREKLSIAVSVFPADELQVQLRAQVSKEPSNIILWQSYIEATQCSMSHCSADSVLMLYKNCLATLHKLRRGTALNKSLLEESILRVLHQCGLFLKQAGLFEQLWTLLRSYLKMNLSPLMPNKFCIDSSFHEKQLLELEDVIFNSQLPLHELWLRTEKLRESCHWLPCSSGCDDPQRIVFTEDVSDLIHPITMPGNIFTLITTVLTILKVPLLPCRHTTMRDLGLDHVPWSLDSIEALLAMFYSMYGIDLENVNILNDNSLVNGPQYLKTLPGQNEYLQFVLKIMSSCIDCLNGTDKIAVAIWWFRFQRLLIILDKQKRFALPETLKKKFKSNIKNLLRSGSLRNNFQFYCEYALVEKELNSCEAGMDVLTRLLIVDSNLTVTATPSYDQIGICHIYRTLTEIIMAPQEVTESEKNKALKCLVDYVTGKGYNNNQLLTQGSIHEASLIFKHITLQLLQTDIPLLTPAEQFLPDFFSDWIVCNGWFYCLTEGPLKCGVFLENILAELDKKKKRKLFQEETLYEFYVSVLFKYCLHNPGSGTFKILDDVLHRAIGVYPNNLFLLSVLAKEQSLQVSMGQNWWKVKNLLLKTNRAFPIIFLVLISNHQMVKFRQAEDTITGKPYEIDESFKHKMMSLFRRITRDDICTRRCGLIWRLYLQFIHAYFDPVLCRNVYYKAVEQCPWLKALYVDAAIYIPAELTKIQDLIIEKQLRIHVTPEELEILRL